VFAALGLGVAVVGRWITGFFAQAEGVVSAGAGYFQVMGLVYGFMAVSVILFAAYQGWGRATTPLVVSLLRLVVVVLGGWVLLQQANVRLEWLYYLIASSVIVAASTLGLVFLFRPPIRRDKTVSG
jgi:Na+-driven multidrug efflux pump